jgi:hypothetical protein
MPLVRCRRFVPTVILVVVAVLSAVPDRSLHAMVKPADSGPLHSLDPRVSTPGVLPCMACHDRPSSVINVPSRPMSGEPRLFTADGTTRCSGCHAGQ